MADTRKHLLQICLQAEPERVFDLLITPSDIREWWGAARAIVMAESGGYWAAAWGENEDFPDYMTIARIETFERPNRLELADYRYFAAREGPLPFDSNFRVTFEISTESEGTLLRVEQDGFPIGPTGDDFYHGCEVGWQQTFASIEAYLARESES